MMNTGKNMHMTMFRKVSLKNISMSSPQIGEDVYPPTQTHSHTTLGPIVQPVTKTSTLAYNTYIFLFIF